MADGMVRRAGQVSQMSGRECRIGSPPPAVNASGQRDVLAAACTYFQTSGAVLLRMGLCAVVKSPIA
ncbi:hypothetical protein NDU88_001814 [Pleurodeles waltl]|uniref:Uncharacterized protein n=1 Tax=Pleurodeles waltl TaxID=8319 RepID=A0AAV7LYQ8_PLEWA|nr:hypothetical protein NDU88_001814 [Pleurodeles waltl]